MCFSELSLTKHIGNGPIVILVTKNAAQASPFFDELAATVIKYGTS